MKPFAADAAVDQATTDLRDLIAHRIATAGWADADLTEADRVALLIVETLTWSRPDILDALAERPRRCWLMSGSRWIRPLMFRGGDEFGNPTVAVRVSPHRFWILSYRWRLNLLREPSPLPLMVQVADAARDT